MKTVTEKLLVILFGGMLVYGTGVEAGVYRWVDEDGKVHFGDRPGSAESAEEVTVKQEKSAAQPVPGEANREQTRQRLLERYEQERMEKKAAAEQRKTEQARRKRNCAIARDRLKVYQQSALYDIDENGERVFLSDAERKQALAEARKDVKQWCN
jgi:hypothetical protein